MNKEYQNTLRNCPFCGGEAIVLQNDEGFYYIGCKNAECIGYVFYNKVYYSLKERGIKSWNTRKPIDDQIQEMQDEIQELRIITGLMQKRKYYKKFVDEVWRRQEGYELSSPDADYIYKLYFELIEERDKFIEQLKEVSFVDIDEEYADDGQRMLFLHDAIEIVKGGKVDA